MPKALKITLMIYATTGSVCYLLQIDFNFYFASKVCMAGKRFNERILSVLDFKVCQMVLDLYNIKCRKEKASVFTFWGNYCVIFSHMYQFSVYKRYTVKNAW